MITTINENIRIWQEFNPIELSMEFNWINSVDSKHNLAKLGFIKARIAIKNRWFDVLTLCELVRKRNNSDGYYRVVYIQINMESGEYYIGKANRPKWSELIRYQGSGLKIIRIDLYVIISRYVRPQMKQNNLKHLLLIETYYQMKSVSILLLVVVA